MKRKSLTVRPSPKALSVVHNTECPSSMTDHIYARSKGRYQVFRARLSEWPQSLLLANAEATAFETGESCCSPQRPRQR